MRPEYVTICAPFVAPNGSPAVDRIAHRAGNSRRALQLAIEAGVDWIEIDVWYSYGRLIARHEWGVWRVPLVYDSRRLHVLRHRLIDLEDVIRLTEGGPRLFIDLKGAHRRLPGAIVRALRKHDAADRAAVCGQHWPPLDAIAEAEPRIEIFHSLGRPEHLEAYAAREHDRLVPAGISIARSLVTPELVENFHKQERKLFAWTVNDWEQASQLAAWRVDGIISDRLDLLAALA